MLTCTHKIMTHCNWSCAHEPHDRGGPGSSIGSQGGHPKARHKVSVCPINPQPHLLRPKTAMIDNVLAHAHVHVCS